MRLQSSFALLCSLQLLFTIAARGEDGADTHCLGCGYTVDAPPPLDGADIPRCKDSLCLVQALLDKTSLIYVEQDINISGSGPLPDVTSEVTIMGTCSEGTPCKIDAKGDSQIFIVGLNGYLTLKDLEITGAYCQKGAAVTVSGSGSNDFNKGGKFVALNVRFTNNSATDFGAALNVESGGTVYVKDCIFQSNTAGRGGAVYVGSSKGFPADGENNTDTESISCALNSCTTFVNTEFSGNSADYGGAVFVDDAAKDCKFNGGANFDCTTCSFGDNFAQRDGGAVFVNYQSTGAMAFFRKTRFKKNTAENDGGDIATQQGEHGSRGARVYAYQVAFAGSNASKGSSVSVKPYSLSTFARCDFSHGAALQCEGSCDQLCPLASPLSNGSVPSRGPCPISPPPLCGWVPRDCAPPTPSLPPPLLSPPPPSPSPPPPSPPPPSPSPSPPPPPPPPSPPPPSPPPPAWKVHPEPPPLPPPPRNGNVPRQSRRAAADRHRHRNGSITGDPHFVGKHGERFDFHGKGGRDYCIVSDRQVHVNMHVFRGLHRRSTFISKIGLLFKMDQVLIDAQANKAARLFEDQWKIVVNKIELLQGKTRETPSGLVITHLAHAVQVIVKGELDIYVTIRPASFGRFASGANYLDFQINQLKVSSSVHGVLGQTYQETAKTYEKMHKAKVRRLKRSRAAALYMDGSESDYMSTGILAPDCKYSAYLDEKRLSKKVHRMVLEGAEAWMGMDKGVIVRQCTGFGHSLCPSQQKY